MIIGGKPLCCLLFYSDVYFAHAQNAVCLCLHLQKKCNDGNYLVADKFGKKVSEIFDMTIVGLRSRRSDTKIKVLTTYKYCSSQTKYKYFTSILRGKH